MEEPRKVPKGNKFAILDLSSDSESSDYENEAQSEENKRVENQNEKINRQVEQPPYRHWDTNVQEEAGTIFSKGKKKKVYKKKDDDGWTSIVWNKPQFVNEDEEEKKIKQELIEEAAIPVTPPYYDEPVKEETEVENTKEENKATEKEHKTTQLAKEWAAKIKADLEKAEAVALEKASTTKKKELSDDFIASLSKLSFFRKPMVVTKD